MLLCAFAFRFLIFREKVYSKSALCTFKSGHFVAMATASINSYHQVGRVQPKCLQACSTATITTVLVVEQLLGLLKAIIFIPHPQ